MDDGKKVIMVSNKQTAPSCTIMTTIRIIINKDMENNHICNVYDKSEREREKEMSVVSNIN